MPLQASCPRAEGAVLAVRIHSVVAALPGRHLQRDDGDLQVCGRGCVGEAGSAVAINLMPKEVRLTQSLRHPRFTNFALPPSIPPSIQSSRSKGFTSIISAAGKNGNGAANFGNVDFWLFLVCLPVSLVLQVRTHVHLLMALLQRLLWRS